MSIKESEVLERIGAAIDEETCNLTMFTPQLFF